MEDEASERVLVREAVEKTVGDGRMIDMSVDDMSGAERADDHETTDEELGELEGDVLEMEQTDDSILGLQSPSSHSQQLQNRSAIPGKATSMTVMKKSSRIQQKVKSRLASLSTDQLFSSPWTDG